MIAVTQQVISLSDTFPGKIFGALLRSVQRKICQLTLRTRIVYLNRAMSLKAGSYDSLSLHRMHANFVATRASVVYLERGGWKGWNILTRERLRGIRLMTKTHIRQHPPCIRRQLADKFLEMLPQSSKVRAFAGMHL